MLNKLKKRLYKNLHEAMLQFEKLKYTAKFLPSFSKLKEEEEKLDQKILKFKDFQFPFYKYDDLNHFFMKYLMSAKDPDEYSFNKSNLLFILGVQNIGKSWFIKYNLKTMEEMDINPRPQIMHWDLKEEIIINFEVFIRKLEDLLVKSIMQSNLLHEEIIENIINYKFADEYIEIFMKDVIKGWIEDFEELSLNLEDRGNLEMIWNEFIKNKGKKIIYKIELPKIIEILQKYYEDNKIRTKLEIYLAILRKIEHENRGKSFSTSYYRSGIETTDFLFDIINYLSGYHDLNCYLKDVEEKLPYDIIFKKYAHFSLVLENFDTIYENITDFRFHNIFDHWFLRFYTDTKCRTHFPMIIESKNSHFFNRLIFEMMHVSEEEFSAIELYGFREGELKMNLSHIYQGYDLEKISDVFGYNIYDWQNITDEILKYDNNHIEKILDFESEYIDKERIILNAKINSAFTKDDAFLELDDGTIDFKILNFFENFAKLQGAINVNLAFNDAQFLDNSIIKALFNANILYQRKYFGIFHVSKYLYVHLIREWVEDKKNKFGILDKIKYKYFTMKYGLDYSSAHLFKSNEPDSKAKFDDDKKFFDFELTNYREKLMTDEDYKYPIYKMGTVKYKK